MELRPKTQAKQAMAQTRHPPQQPGAVAPRHQPPGGGRAPHATHCPIFLASSGEQGLHPNLNLVVEKCQHLE